MYQSCTLCSLIKYLSHQNFSDTFLKGIYNNLLCKNTSLKEMAFTHEVGKDIFSENSNFSTIRSSV